MVFPMWKAPVLFLLLEAEPMPPGFLNSGKTAAASDMQETQDRQTVNMSADFLNI